MPSLRDMELVQASVRSDATFSDAAEALCRSGVAAIAVVDDAERVVGIFTGDDLLRGLYPRYLGEMRHTAFLRRDAEEFGDVSRTAGEPVRKHMQEPQTVDLDTSGAHVAERFLHLEAAALAVVEGGRFRGMVDEVAFCRHVMQRARADG